MRRAPTPWQRLTGIATLPEDSADLRLQKQLQVAMGLLSLPVIGAWGGLFVIVGRGDAVVFHAAYLAGTLLLLLLLAWTKRWSVFRAPHLALVALAPFALELYLGGFGASGGATLWCLLSPAGAVMFLGIRRAVWFLLGVLAMLLVSYGRARLFPGGAVPLSPGQAAFFLWFNATGFAVFFCFSIGFFVNRLDREKARSERLLLNVLPAPIAERLKRDEGIIADRFGEVTVLFSDLVGFTTLSARLPPAEIVDLLNEVFSAFDGLADRFGLEKIKTIGDAYMVVGGLPEPRPDHAARVADMALAMRDVVADFSTRRGLPLAMRIGLHSGEVVAGVIGRRKFSYDLWGDTVNTASRMESHGEPGRIHVSEATAERLGAAFVCVARGAISVKGKGEMRTFWVEGRS